MAGIREYLFEQLWPNLTAARRAFAARREQLNLPPGIVIEPPPAFEGDRFRAAFTFTDSHEWSALCRKLGAIAPEAIDELCRRP